jgi:ribosomal small subunit protein bTHX
MGKGDKKTKLGKIAKGSFGKRRKRKHAAPKIDTNKDSK